MEKKENNVRFTIDIPESIHQKMKIVSALTKKTMRQLILDSMELNIKKLKVHNKSSLQTT